MSIVPSTRLKVVSVHKLKTMTCYRKYYWRYVLNLESKAMNLNFWYGGVLGAGFEAMLQGQNWKAAMQDEHQKRCAGMSIHSELVAEMDLQYRLIGAILAGAATQSAVKQMTLTESQVPIRMQLSDSDVLYCGTADGIGDWKGLRSLFEIKTASRVNAAYLSALSFDPQIYSYSMTPATRGCFQCAYCIFTKTQKRVKRRQTIDEFVAEITDDIVARPDMYYQWHKVSLGKATLEANREDVEATTAIMARQFDDLGDRVLDYSKWPKQPDKCFDYAGCEFLPLCKNAATWQHYLRMYRQRTILYEEERAELANDRVAPVSTSIAKKKVNKKAAKVVKKKVKATKSPKS